MPYEAIIEARKAAEKNQEQLKKSVEEGLRMAREEHARKEDLKRRGLWMTYD